MYDHNTGVYYYTADSFPHASEYRFDNAYYIRYNSKKALFALTRLKEMRESFPQDEGVFLSHLYLDLLFEAVGLIVNRFIDKASDSFKDNESRTKQIDLNRKEYGFSRECYPLLSNSDIRNHLEHIDVKDQILIEKGQYRGTYNVIYPNMDAKVEMALTDFSKPQNNLLDLKKMTFSVLTSNRVKNIENASITELSIDLLKLEKELTEINNISNRIWDYMQNPLFR